MKKLFVLSFLAIFLISLLQAQNRYGQTTFALDTLSGTDAITYTLPPAFGSENVTEMSTWQIRILNLADTLTVNVYLEETIDEDSSPNYVIVDTIVSSGSSVGSNTLSYLKHYAIRGKKQRVRVTSSGTNATAQIEVDAWIRNKVPLQLTDEI